jgi:carboxyl-terminal processing protease
MIQFGVLMRRFLIASLSVGIGVFIGVLLTPLISGDSIYEQFYKFQYVFNTAYQNYVEEVDPEKLNEAAIEGMLNELDVHSVYMTAEEMKAVNEDFKGSFDGIGVQFNVVDDTITIVSAISGGPSEKLGIMSGDKIVKIDGEDAIGMDRNKVPDKLRGPKGTIVNVDIKRTGVDELLNFDIERDKIPLYSLETAFLLENSDIGFFRINRFMATTHEELVKAAAELKSKGMKKMILDLRGNPGGYLDQAFKMADEFIKGGDTIVYTKGRLSKMDDTFIAKDGGILEDIPVIVLVDRGSASASEIVSGAIQDLDRGMVLGETSFGKGLVQRQFPLSDGSAFRLTISKYYTPSGRCIQRPYKDKDKYRSLYGRLDLKEGMNMEHALELVRAENDSTGEEMNIDSIMYKTKAGRPVLGGGGISPDYIVKYDTTSIMYRKILGKNLFFLFVDQFMQGEGAKLKEKFGSDFSAFKSEFKVDDKILAKFKDYVISKDVEWSDKDYAYSKSTIQKILKGNIATSIWSRDRNLEIYYEDEKMVEKAKELFPEAVKIAKMRK